jgi:hypothetical protein
MIKISVAKPKHYVAKINGVMLSCAMLSEEWELAYNDGMGWEAIARSSMKYAGSGMFLAAKRAMENGMAAEDIGRIQWTGTKWEVLSFDQVYDF